MERNKSIVLENVISSGVPTLYNPDEEGRKNRGFYIWYEESSEKWKIFWVGGVPEFDLNDDDVENDDYIPPYKVKGIITADSITEVTTHDFHPPEADMDHCDFNDHTITFGCGVKEKDGLSFKIDGNQLSFNLEASREIDLNKDDSPDVTDKWKATDIYIGKNNTNPPSMKFSLPLINGLPPEVVESSI